MLSGSRAIRAVVAGAVQGVGLRVAVRSRARELGVMGWVRNADDGAIVVHAEGRSVAIDALGAFLRDGPPAADVQDVTVEGGQDRGPRAVRGPRRQRRRVCRAGARRHGASLRSASRGRGRDALVGCAQGPIARPGCQALGSPSARSCNRLQRVRGPNGRRSGDRVGSWRLRAGRQGRLARGAGARPRRVRPARREASRWVCAATHTPGSKSQWLLIKRRDEQACPGSDIAAEGPASVLSSRTWRTAG